MTKAECLRRAKQIPLVEFKRLDNTLAYIEKVNPEGEELRSVLMGLSPAALRLFLDMIEEGIDDERPETNVPGDH